MRVEDLERELRAERPEIDPEFARELDDWAAAGFPRNRGLGPRALAGRRDPLEAVRRALARLRSVPPRRIALPIGAIATVAVIGAVAIGGLDDGAEQSPQLSTEPATGGEAGGAGAKPQADAPSAPGPDAERGLATPSQATPELAPDDTALPLPDDFPVPPGAGGIAPGADRRIVDASAQLTLGADADEVQEVANEIVSVTDRHGGVVIDSRVTTDEGGARAAFTLEIPYRRLDAALTDLSGLADVISRTEAGRDITGQAVSARRQLAKVVDDLRRARIDLIEADSREERRVARARIASLRARADALTERLKGVKRQGRFATVSVDVTSDAAVADDGWGLGDAVDNAREVLETIAGVALVALAALVPLALIAALAWLIAARAQRARRERALGD